jgi:hypothetical protein
MDPNHKVKYRHSEKDGKYHLLPGDEWPHVIAARERAARRRAEEVSARSKGVNNNARAARLAKMSQPPAESFLPPRRPKYTPLPRSFTMVPTGSPLSGRRNTTRRNTRTLNTYDQDVQQKIIEYTEETGKTVHATLQKLKQYSPEFQDLIIYSLANGGSLQEAFDNADFYS